MPKTTTSLLACAALAGLACVLHACGGDSSGGGEGGSRDAAGQDTSAADTSTGDASPPDATADGPGAMDSTLEVGGDAAGDGALDAPGDSARDAGLEADAPVTCVGFGPPVLLASNLGIPRGVAVDDVNVYVSGIDAIDDQAEAIYQLPKGAAGAAPLEIAGPEQQPVSLASDGAHVYWLDTLSPSAARRVAVGGNGASTLGSFAALGMALDATSLYWVSGQAAQSMPKGGGPVQTLGTTSASGAGVGVAVDATHFYFAMASSLSTPILSVPIAGGAVSTLAKIAGDLTSLAVDATSLYFVDGDSLSAIPRGGGAVKKLASHFSGATQVVLDSGYVYAPVDASGGAIVRAPVGGGATVTLASDPSWSPYRLAIDATSVYWVDFRAGTLMKVAKCGEATDGGPPDAAADAPTDAGPPTDASTDAADGSVCPAPLDLCGGRCVDLRGDSLHCGHCARVCSGTAPVCIDGACGPAPTQVATGSQIAAVAVDATQVYWTDSSLLTGMGSVIRAPKAGGAPVTIASMPGQTFALALDSTDLFYSDSSGGSDGGALRRLPLGADAGAPSLVANEGASALAVSGGSLCFAGSVAGCVAKTGGTPVVFGPSQDGTALAIAADKGAAFWTLWSSNGYVSSSAIAGGAVRLLVPHTDRPLGIAVDAASVYWASSGTGEILAMPRGGGAVTTLASGPGSPLYLVLDAGQLVWTAGLDSNNGAVFTMPATGGTPRALAWDTYDPWQLALDATSVYWVSAGSVILKAPR